LPDLDAYKRLRETVRLPIFAVVVPGSPWFAPSTAQLQEIGIEAALYPAAVLSRILIAVRDGLEAVRTADGAPPVGFDVRSLGAILKTGDWAALDQRFAAP
jgi:2-methylisocitrate lyase-like PEP mutase family enzyme